MREAGKANVSYDVVLMKEVVGLVVQSRDAEEEGDAEGERMR